MNLRAVLSPDELERAERFRFPEHRARFIVARGTLRNVLASYLGRDAETLVFDYGESGKPHLTECVLHFNLSHSESELLIAVAHHEVGVDLERLQDTFDFLPIAEAHFEPDEIASLCALSSGDRARRFLEIWTCREALSKARGLGIADGLKSSAQAGWSVNQITAPAGYVAALAVPCEKSSIKYFDWNTHQKS